MSDPELARFFLSMVLLLAAAFGCGRLFELAGMPRVIGEIAGGALLGPSVFGALAPGAQAWVFAGFPEQEALLSAFYWFGLVLLMFTAGFSVERGRSGSSRRLVPALVLGALGLPFVLGFVGAPLFEETRTGDPLAFELVMGIAVAVTSIPVVSRIFLDLGLMGTQFARDVIGAATVQDLVLWTALAVATAVQNGEDANAAGILRVVAITAAFVLASFFLAPSGVRLIRRRLVGKPGEAALTGYAILFCLVFVAAASLLQVNIVFGALVAGLVVGRFPSRHLFPVKERIAGIAVWFFVPIYFALVGLRLDLLHELDLALTATFILASTVIKLASSAVFAGIGGAGWGRALDYGVAMNTRGGPGIVLASVAHGAGIVDGRMFTALVLASIVTSLGTGLWLRWRLSCNPAVFVDRAQLPAE